MRRLIKKNRNLNLPEFTQFLQIFKRKKMSEQKLDEFLKTKL